jgi:hypothetical protein
MSDNYYYHKGGRLCVELHHHKFLGMDIMLGMDWLRKYDGVVLCAKRAIHLTQEDGITMEFMIAILAN